MGITVVKLLTISIICVRLGVECGHTITEYVIWDNVRYFQKNGKSRRLLEKPRIMCDQVFYPMSNLILI